MDGKEIKPAKSNPDWTALGAEALGNVCTAVLVFSMIPMMFGMIDSTAVVGVLCWLVPCFIFVIIAVTLMLKHGSVASACLTATMTGVLLCNIGVRGLVLLGFMTRGQKIPQTIGASFDLISGGGFLTGAVFLLAVGVATIKGKNTVQGAAMVVAAVGFIFMALGAFGVSILTMVGFCLLLLVVLLLFIGAIKTVSQFVIEKAAEESR